MSTLPDYYAKLLILQYLGGQKNYDAIKTLVTPVVMDELPVDVQNAYNLNGDDPAVGVQLDVIGKYVGVSRTGFGFSGPITLSDADYLTLIRFAILRNAAGSSLATIQELVWTYFPDQVYVFDYQNMHMSYLISSAVGSQDLVQMMVAQGMLPVPMAVQLAVVIYAPIIDKFFGFRTYLLDGFKVSPFNSYTDYQTDRPWLSYSYGVTPEE